MSNDYQFCRDSLLKRLQERAPSRIQLLTGPRQVGKTTLLLDVAAQFGDAAVYAAGDEPDAALPAFGSAVGQKPRRELVRARLSCCWTRFSISPTGRSASKDSGMTCGDAVFPCTLLRQARRHCV